MTVMEIAETIVASLLSDMNGRRGFDSAWDDIDPDIQEEIRSEWVDLTAARLREAGVTDGESVVDARAHR